MNTHRTPRTSTRLTSRAALWPVLVSLSSGCSLWDGLFGPSPLDCVAKDDICATESVCDTEQRRCVPRKPDLPDAAMPPPPADLGNPEAALNLDQPGPYQAAELATLSVRLTLEETSATTKLAVFGPDNKKSAPFPVVLFSPGFGVPASATANYYKNYAQRLANYGIVTVLQTVEDQTHNEEYLDYTRKLIAWLRNPQGPEATKIRDVLDMNKLGLLGHAQGASISLLTAAAGDTQAKAVMAIDPVDLRSTSVQAVLDDPNLLSGIPIHYLVQTRSKQISDIDCNPMDFNYQALFANTRSPAQVVTVVGAAHNDFLDECGDKCARCAGGTAPKDRTNRIAVRTATAYFLRYLKNDMRADSYLTGDKIEEDVKAGYVAQSGR